MEGGRGGGMRCKKETGAHSNARLGALQMENGGIGWG